MSKYDNITLKEYAEKKLEMLNDLGRRCEVCVGVSCSNCPLSISNNKTDESCNVLELLCPEKAIEIVMNYEPKVDWTKVPVDTKILVKNHTNEDWKKRHFAKYEDNKIYAYDNGKSSFTTDIIASWNYAKLYKEE